MHATVLFHLNLCYSSLRRDERANVLRRCYRPLLELPDRVEGLKLALEAPAHTLEIADQLDPEWTAELARLVEAGTVEFVGSGDSQLIGPLVPERVHQANQNLGVADYRRRFGRAPEVALVNEMAFSQGLVDAYVEAGYRALVVEWNNARHENPDWSEELRFVPARTRSPRGQAIDLLWADTVAFQNVQRVVQGQLDAEHYLEWLDAQAGPGLRHLFVYAGDAEVFDHRPGRYATEPKLVEGEWDRFCELLNAVGRRGVEWTTPSAVLESARAQGLERTELTLSTAAAPIPVKKQLKYNVGRWAVSGRDDLRLNAACHSEAVSLASRVAPLEDWRGLCRRWASDLRTHIAEDRWCAIEESLDRLPANERLPELPTRPSTDVRWRQEGRRIVVETEGIAASFLVGRGLAIERLSFIEHGDEPWLGTLPLGTFDAVPWSADFYSGHLVIDVPGKPRVTDLAEGPIEILESTEGLCLTVKLPTTLGLVEKRVFVGRDSLRVGWDFTGLSERPAGSVRLGMVTLMDQAFGERLFVTTVNGGARERYPIAGSIDQTASVSPVVSSKGGFGATDGRLVLDDGDHGVELLWDPTRTPVMPLLQHEPIGERRFCRVSLSLAEQDDTFKEGGVLPAFELLVRGFSRGRPGSTRP